jgi:hypothetical protein
MIYKEVLLYRPAPPPQSAPIIQLPPSILNFPLSPPVISPFMQPPVFPSLFSMNQQQFMSPSFNQTNVPLADSKSYHSMNTQEVKSDPGLAPYAPPGNMHPSYPFGGQVQNLPNMMAPGMNQFTMSARDKEIYEHQLRLQQLYVQSLLEQQQQHIQMQFQTQQYYQQQQQQQMVQQSWQQKDVGSNAMTKAEDKYNSKSVPQSFSSPNYDDLNQSDMNSSNQKNFRTYHEAQTSGFNVHGHSQSINTNTYFAENKHFKEVCCIESYC